MPIFLLSIFTLELALLFIHEMDAVRRQEWKMFIVLKDMPDEKAHWAFTLLHIPLYTALLFLLLSPHMRLGFYITNIFLIAHAIIHLIFKRHPANQLNGVVSKIIIYLMGLLALVHLLFLSI